MNASETSQAERRSLTGVPFPEIPASVIEKWQVIVDTLAARKLPSLWLMVTRPAPQPVDQVFDFMMRPAGPSTFSNFDFLPHALPLPPGFPEHMVLRSDHPSLSVAIGLVPRLMPLFTAERGKELLISPKGLRPPAAETSPTPLFASRRPRREPDRVLAASTTEPTSAPTGWSARTV